MNIDDELFEAWKGVTPPPSDEITTHRCFECDELTAFFRGRPWTEFVNVEALRYNAAAITAFTPRAFHYYLPAFMRATFADPVGADVIPGSIVFNLRSDFDPADTGRLRLFTSAQRRVLARFLRALAPLGITDEEEVETLAALIDEK